MKHQIRIIGYLSVLQSGFVEKGFISSYIPMVTTVLLECPNCIVKIEQVMENFTKRFGFTIDRAPMTNILNRCAKDGIVYLDKSGYYVINREGCSSMLYDIVLRENKAEYNSVVSELVDFY